MIDQSVNGFQQQTVAIRGYGHDCRFTDRAWIRGYESNIFNIHTAEGNQPDFLGVTTRMNTMLTTFLATLRNTLGNTSNARARAYS